MIEGPIWRGLLSFAFPIFVGSLFQQFYSTADALIVGNLINKEALAAVSSSGNLIFLMVGFFNGMAMGAGVLISRYYGAKDYPRMRIAIHTDLAFGLLCGIFLTGAGVLLTPHLLRLMGTPANVLPSSIAYFRTYFLGSMASFLYSISTGILQAMGDSRRPLFFLILSSIVNVGLDLLFVGVFHGGVASAAGATVISQVISAVLCLLLLTHLADENCRVNLRQVRIDGGMLRMIVRLGVPSGVQNSVINLANVIVQANINAFGDSAMAGCGSYAKIEGFAFLPVTCFSMGLATFVGQNLGAKQYDRTKAGARFGLVCAGLMAELIGVTIWLSAPHLISLFNSDPEVVAFGVRQARVISLFYGLVALNHCVAGILRGAGRAVVPMVIMMAVWCVLRVTWITFAVRMWHTITVVFVAYPMTWTVSLILFFIYYAKADWLHAFDRLDARSSS